MVRPLDFVRNQLRMNPEATYEEVRARANLEDVKVHQTTYGRARSQLGLSPRKTRARERDVEEEPVAVRPARPAPGSDLPGDLNSLVNGLRQAIVQKDRYRILMETVLRLFEDVLKNERQPEPVDS